METGFNFRANDDKMMKSESEHGGGDGDDNTLSETGSYTAKTSKYANSPIKEEKELNNEEDNLAHESTSSLRGLPLDFQGKQRGEDVGR